MDKLKSIVKNPNSSDAETFIQNVSQGTTKCTTFVNEATTAKVYKICTHKKTCTKDCLAIKINKGAKFDEKEIDIHQKITSLVKGTPAESHFNKFYGVLRGKSKEGILSEYEDRREPYSNVSDLLQKAEIGEDLWKSINFQLILAIYAAQQVIPGFAHNDTHTENILIVPNDTAHVCKIKSPKGKEMVHYNNVLVRIIDFGQVLALDESMQTRDGIKFYKKTCWQNKMIDFVRFAVWAIVDISYFEERKVENPSWYQDWLDFLSRWLDSRFFILGNSPEFVDKTLGMAPNEKGGKWLQEHYGPLTDRGIGNMLDDPYFDLFVSKQASFSAQIKPRKH